MTEERGVVTYQAKDGQEVKLTFETIKKFLVHGKPELVSNQEMVFFIGICKARGLNPFAKDCYLIKYSGDPAAIVTSIDYFRARAKAQRDCRGWESGIIVEDLDGNIRYSKGLIKKNETLLGGWFKARPKDWDHDFDLEVNLSGYIKKTKEGNITKFWAPENQPTMIRKVAESQGLREIWPDEFAKLYVEEEIDRTEMRDNLFGIDMEKSDDISRNGKDIYEVKDTLEDSNLTPPRSIDKYPDGIKDRTDAEKLAEGQAKLDEKRKAEPEIIDEKTAFREKWVNLKSAGYSTYIHKNFSVIETECKRWPDLHQEMIEKWVKLYPTTEWPLSNVQNPPQVKTSQKDEGQSIGDESKVHPDQASAISAGILKRKEEEKVQGNGYVRCPFNQNKAKAVKICQTCTEKERCQPYQEYFYNNPPE